MYTCLHGWTAWQLVREPGAGHDLISETVAIRENGSWHGWRLRLGENALQHSGHSKDGDLSGVRHTQKHSDSGCGGGLGRANIPFFSTGPLRHTLYDVTVRCSVYAPRPCTHCVHAKNQTHACSRCIRLPRRDRHPHARRVPAHTHCLHTHLRACTSACVSAYVCAHPCTHVYTHTSVRMSTRMSAHMPVCTHVYTLHTRLHNVHAHAHAHTHQHTLLHTRLRTRLHAYPRTRMSTQRSDSRMASAPPPLSPFKPDCVKGKV